MQMSKNAIIFHGTGGNPDVCWYQWVAGELKVKGYRVSIPYYPTLNKEAVETFLPHVYEDNIIDSETVLIGHSGGAALILSVLEHSSVKIRQAILVAGYATPPNTSQEPVLQAAYDWNKIRAHAEEFYFINSITDPYGCDDKQGRLMFDQLGGTQIIRNDGHFGDYNQPFPTFELVNNLIA
jgi:hypothetical protein